ncbi:MAG: GHKL domain-containing protein [Eubacteriales bacterium]|nr:GHKL domain-containing protein [Eubacteriales bacterium]
MTDVILCAASNLFRMYVIYRFMKVLLGERRTSGVVEILVYVGFYLVNTGAYLLFHLMWVNILCNLIGIGLIVMLYTRSVKTIFFVTCSVYIVNMVCDVGVTLLFIDYRDGEQTSPFLGVLVVFIIFICELFSERLVKTRRTAFVESKALVLLPLCSVLMNAILLYSDSVTDFGMVLVNWGLLLINFLVFHLYEMLSRELYQKYENASLQQKLQSYANQMKLMMESEEKVKALRHDMKHHMNEIRLLAGQDKTGEIQNYIDAMQEFVSNPEEIVASGNWEIDSVLNYMLQRAKKELDTVEVQVQLPEKFSHVFDLNVILGNLLENAIEGAGQTEERRLKVSIMFARGILQIEIENSFDGRVDREQDRFLTTKPDKELHGIGLHNVRKIVKKYDGLMEMRAEKDTFFVKILLYIEVENKRLNF